jgi:hypothetical protein
MFGAGGYSGPTRACAAPSSEKDTKLAQKLGQL